MTRILIAGASGYIGGRLVPVLAQRGDDLTLIGRDPGALTERFPGTRVVGADLLDPASLPPALAGIEVAYYLAHSMAGGESGFAERDLQAARAFASAAAGAGVRRIIYLGGLGDDTANLSHHLASRHDVGAELARHGVAVTEFRAAIVIGSGSASFEILRHLTERLPVMITPRWVSTRCQPIGIADVLAYLVGALDHPEVTGVVEIGGPDVLSYGQMMLRYAHLRGLRRLMIPVPVLTPRLSSYWVNLISPVPASIARPLIEGLRNEVVVRHPEPARAFGIAPSSYDEALELAMDRSGPARIGVDVVRRAPRPRAVPACVTAVTRGDVRRPPDEARRGEPGPALRDRGTGRRRIGLAVRQPPLAHSRPRRSRRWAASGCAWAVATPTGCAWVTRWTSGASRRSGGRACCGSGPR